MQNNISQISQMIDIRKEGKCGQVSEWVNITEIKMFLVILACKIYNHVFMGEKYC